MKRTIAIILLLCSLIPTLLHAQVAVGIIPFKGDGNEIKLVQNKIKEELIKTKGVVIVSDKMMKDIVKIHEQAMASGTGYHDISKMRVAEFIVTGRIDGTNLTMKAVDVNTSGEVFTMTVNLADNRDYQIRKISRELQNSLIGQVGSAGRDIPADAKPYMKIVKEFVSALPQGNEACWKYLAFYTAGAYQRPSKALPDLVGQAKIMLEEVRPTLQKTNITYFGIEQGSPFVFLTVFSERMGKRSKHKFGIMELPDGSLVIGSYDLVK